jgi:hypothetical protein
MNLSESMFFFGKDSPVGDKPSIFLLKYGNRLVLPNLESETLGRSKAPHISKKQILANLSHSYQN